MKRAAAPGEPRILRLIMELRRLGVTDAAVLGAIERVPRELFVPEQFLDQAYENIALPIGDGQTISQPLIVGLMTQALEVDRPHEGARGRHRLGLPGRGAVAGCAAGSIPSSGTRRCLKPTEERFRKLRLHNITAIAGDGSRGWPEQAPFDRIIVTAAARRMPETLLDQLAVGGTMVIPVGERASDQHVVRVRRRGEAEYETEQLWAVRFVPLVSDGNGEG